MRLKKVSLILAAWALSSGAAFAAPEMPISTKDAKAFIEQLRDMGYSPDALDKTSPPSTVIHSGGTGYGVILGGCKELKECSYVVIYGIYSDVKDPPIAWLAEMNKTYDLMKVWTNVDHRLTYSTGVVAEGMSRATFRATVDNLITSGNDLAGEVTKAKIPLTVTAPAKP